MASGCQWFEQQFGFPEHASYGHTQKEFHLDGTRLISNANHASFEIGTFSTPALNELRIAGARVLALWPTDVNPPLIEVRHIEVDGALSLHAAHPGATFQAASQFNCLEFASPDVTPEHGVARYAGDRTQGPDCALACAAGTVWRNYFMPVGPATGQRADVQLNTLDALEAAVDNDRRHYWQVRNGYVIAPARGAALPALAGVIAARRAELMGLIKIGVHAGVGVTFASRWKAPPAPLTVTQTYCSALSLGAYSGGVSPTLWEPLARLVLDAAYESTLWAGVLTAGAARSRNNLAQGGGGSREIDGGGSGTGSDGGADWSRHVFLTFVGGGVFGNRLEWIAAAIGRAVAELEAAGVGGHLVVHVCHFRGIDDSVRDAVDRAVADARAARRGVGAGAGVEARNEL